MLHDYLYPQSCSEQKDKRANAGYLLNFSTFRKSRIMKKVYLAFSRFRVFIRPWLWESIGFEGQDTEHLLYHVHDYLTVNTWITAQCFVQHAANLPHFAAIARSSSRNADSQYQLPESYINHFYFLSKERKFVLSPISTITVNSSIMEEMRITHIIFVETPNTETTLETQAYMEWRLKQIVTRCRVNPNGDNINTDFKRGYNSKVDWK
jgi:hypothetical protein